MEFKSVFKKTIRRTDAPAGGDAGERAPEVPRDLLRRCNHCKEAIFTEEVEENLRICPRCGHYFRIDAMQRIRMICDDDSFEEWNREMPAVNPLQFPGYPEKIREMQKKTGLAEAVVTGKCRIGGYEAVLGVCDGRFMMSSMGEVVGEKITLAAERATEEKLPLILFTCSGGARMQEGIVSLMQMAKTSAALKKHSDAGLLYVTVLTDPTTGGVTASFAMLGDIILAEPGALIGFAGPRVIEQTIGEKLPKGFQRSEFLLEHGFVDAIVKRDEMKETLVRILRQHSCRGREEFLKKFSPFFEKDQDFASHGNTDGEGKEMPETAGTEKYSAWEQVQLSRRADRPTGTAYLETLFENFMELHGDRYYGDDPAVIGGICEFQGMPVTVILQEKGGNTKDKMQHNFGMPSPEGYRKALRLMKQAEKFGRPVLCFVDTPGAFCGMEAEERGQGEAIARNLYEMSALKVPVLSVFIGEGGSGGALAMAVANEVWMLENACYSILSPEGFASILWKDSKKAVDAARVMKLTSTDLLELGIVECVIPEPQDYTRENMDQVSDLLQKKICEFLLRYDKIDGTLCAEMRYQRYRLM